MPDVTVTPTIQSVTVTPTVQSVTVTEGANFAVEFPLSVSSSFIAADQAASAGTWYTLGGLTLGPGTYLVIGQVTGTTTSNAGNMDARIYDGTLAVSIASSSSSTARAAALASITVMYTVTVTSTKLVQLGGWLSVAGTLQYRGANNIANATGIVALRIA